MNWALTLLALCCYSLLGLTLKSAAMKDNNPGRLIWVALVVVSVISLTLGLVSGAVWTWQAVLLGLASGAFFYLASVERVKALQTTPAGVVFAVTNLDLVVNSVVVALIPFFHSPFTPAKGAAAALAGAAIVMTVWSREAKASGSISLHTYISLGLLVFAGMGFTLYSQLAMPVALFMFFDHVAGVGLNIREARNVTSGEIRWGLGVGALMFVGLWSLMTSMSMAPTLISQTLIVVSMNTVAVAVLSWVVLKEKLSQRQVLALLLAVGACIVSALA